MIRKAMAVRRGSGRSGNGELSSDSGVLANTPYSEGFRISRSALTLRASVPNLDQGTCARLAQDDGQNCPVSRVLRAEITLDGKLV
jgi:osmotically inducible protein OsmC